MPPLCGPTCLCAAWCAAAMCANLACVMHEGGAMLTQSERRVFGALHVLFGEQAVCCGACICAWRRRMHGEAEWICEFTCASHLTRFWFLQVWSSRGFHQRRRPPDSTCWTTTASSPRRHYLLFFILSSSAICLGGRVLKLHAAPLHCSLPPHPAFFPYSGALAPHVPAAAGTAPQLL